MAIKNFIATDPVVPIQDVPFADWTQKPSIVQALTDIREAMRAKGIIVQPGSLNGRMSYNSLLIASLVLMA